MTRAQRLGIIADRTIDSLKGDEIRVVASLLATEPSLEVGESLTIRP